MAENNSASPMAGGEGGGPPSDPGPAGPVVLDKVVSPAAPAPAAPPPVPSPQAPPPAPAPAPAAKVEPAPAAPPAPKPQATPAKTLVDPPAEEPKVATPADWPDDWRAKLAGDDKKLLARLEKMGSVKDLLNSYRALEQRLSSGEYKKALPNNFTEEELADYRKSNGIPDKPEGYDTALGGGFVWGEADKPVLTDFTKFAHEANLPSDAVKSVLGWYAAWQQQEADATAQKDELGRINGDSALRAEWGNNFTGNLAAVRNLFEGPAPELFGVIGSARDVDGVMLFNRPDVVKFISNLSRELNPYSTLVPDSGSTPAKTAESRYDELTKMSADKGSAYWRGPQSQILQAEQRDIITMLIRSGRMDENGKMKTAA